MIQSGVYVYGGRSVQQWLAMTVFLDLGPRGALAAGNEG